MALAIYHSRMRTELKQLDRAQVFPERMDKIKALDDLVQITGWMIEEARTGRVRRRAKTLADVADLDEYRRKYLQFEQDSTPAEESVPERKQKGKRASG